jgi:hypothetical protein
MYKVQKSNNSGQNLCNGIAAFICNFTILIYLQHAENLQLNLYIKAYERCSLYTDLTAYM